MGDTVVTNIDFRQCPHCGGYGVRDNGDNCTTCGGIGRGGLNSPAGSCIGSGELMYEAGTGRQISHAEFMDIVSPEDGHG
jgi:hypothetical protein